MTPATSSTSEGSHVDASPMAWGKTVASRAQKPPVDSSWTTTGMPRRVRSTATRWISLVRLAMATGRKPVEAPMRVTWPMPWRSVSAAASGSNRSPLTNDVIQRQPSWAIFSSGRIRASRSSTRSSTDSRGSR